MKKVLISACLLGLNTKYNGSNNFNEEILKFIKEKDIVIIPICPEQLGGLSTPRFSAEISNGDGFSVLNGESLILDSMANDVTNNFLSGAYMSLKIAQLVKVDYAILKERSPSCGSNFIVKNGIMTQGKGVTAALFSQEGISIFSEDNYREIEEKL